MILGMEFMPIKPSPRPNPHDPFRPDAPADRAVLFVLSEEPKDPKLWPHSGRPTVVHDFIGRGVDVVEDSGGRDELAEMLSYCAPGPGVWMWEGTVEWPRSFDGEVDAPEAIGACRPLTLEEAVAIARDEFPWDRTLWYTEEWLKQEEAEFAKSLREARLLDDLRAACEDAISPKRSVSVRDATRKIFAAAKRLRDYDK